MNWYYLMLLSVFVVFLFQQPLTREVRVRGSVLSSADYALFSKAGFQVKKSWHYFATCCHGNSGYDHNSQKLKKIHVPPILFLIISCSHYSQKLMNFLIILTGTCLYIFGENSHERTYKYIWKGKCPRNNNFYKNHFSQVPLFELNSGRTQSLFCWRSLVMYNTICSPQC